MSTTPPQTDLRFTDLSEGEQRVVAERIAKIRTSGWRPFWCPNPKCNGDPHLLLDEEGRFTLASDMVGPHGEPTGWLKKGRVSLTPHSGRKPGKRVLLDPKWAHNHAREDQRLPPWRKKWTLFVMSGRGSGKTTLGVEFVTLCARKGLDGAILGRRGTEVINTHVATIIARAHPDFMPEYKASKDILVWPNGAITYLFSAEKPENIRSINISYTWTDEAAFMDEIKTAWMNLKMATRVKSDGNPIHHLITSTPTPTEWVMKMEDDPKVIVRRVSTYANKANLDEEFLADLEAEYEGTRTGQQELHGVVLRDVEGSLWNDDMFRHQFVKPKKWDDYIESLDDRVVAVDPAGSKGKRSDATGIIAAGAYNVDENGNPLRSPLYSVLADGTIKGSPSEWAAQVFKVARHVRAHRIIAEKNFGGDMVKQVLEDYAALHPDTTCDENGEAFVIKVEHASQSKEVRAEGTVNKYEQGRVTHITSRSKYGDLAPLEKEQVTWIPKKFGGRSPSPNRVDATVWAIRALDKGVRFRTSMSNPNDVRKMLKKRGGPGGLPGAA